ncbi:MAG: Crp/Fnr family transcriptional regulator [Gammaproteobacteria bacterium]|jgi:CRP-like cAMP-binding protein
MPGEKQVTVGRLDEPPSTTDPADGLAELGLDSTLLTLLRDSLGTARLWRYEAGDTLYHEGSDVEALYVIRRGRIKLLSYLPDGRARILRLHKRGGIIGLNGLLGEVHEHTAVAVDPLEVYRIPLGSVGPLKEHDPVAYSHLLEQWHSYLNYADTWITQFSTGPIRGRVARLLLFLADLDEDSGPGEVTLLSGEEMAEVLGVTPESVSRVLADFKRRRLLLAVGENDTERFRVDLNALSGEAGD